MKKPGFLLLPALLMLSACSDRLSNHSVIKSTLGTPATSTQMLASVENPGPIVFEKILSMEQHSSRGEQVVLDDGRAANAGIENADETISIYFYALRHPTKGLFLIDSGIPKNYTDHFGFLFKKAIADMKFTIVQETNSWIEGSAGAPLQGVFLTHLHFDHAMGVAATPKETPVYVGPNDGSQREFSYRILGNPTDSALSAHGPLRELVFETDPTGTFEGILDIFGDGSLFALHTPGHTPGSVAYLVNSTAGPQLIVGDTIRTKLEWTHSLMPTWYAEGTAAEVEKSAELLREFVAAHPEVIVHPGHQNLMGDSVR